MYRIRAFRASDDEESCMKFINGHERVLNSIGIHKVTSKNLTWIDSKNVYVFIVEDSQTKEVLGGGRIHVEDGKIELPIEEAVKELDSKIISHISLHKQMGGTGELCGLWNSRKVAGSGFGAVFLARSGVAIIDQIGIHSLYSLCASYTVQMGLNLGFHIEKSLGSEGTFYYPKLDLLATVLIHDDLYKLTKAIEEERDAVLKLRSEKNFVKDERYRNKNIQIEYILEI